MSRDASRRALARSSGQSPTFGAEPSVALRGVSQPSNDREFLLFLLGGDPYALPIGVILEILKPLPITEVPRAPRGIAGIASVRGRLVTVIDPRRKFGLAEPEPDRKTRILLVDGGEEIMGLLVDEVKGVHKFEEGQIEPPQVLGGEPPPHVAGVGRNDECWCMLLDLRPVLEVK
jgi:purine-binding chemotaxis protein CheW